MVIVFDQRPYINKELFRSCKMSDGYSDFMHFEVIKDVEQYRKIIGEEKKQEEGGKRDNEGKTRLSLIPPASMEQMAKVLEFGASKYGDHNWRAAGPNLSLLKIVDSLKRHLLSFEKGQDVDEESGLSHIGHILCNAAFLAQLQEDGTLEDDRFKF